MININHPNYMYNQTQVIAPAHEAANGLHGLHYAGLVSGNLSYRCGIDMIKNLAEVLEQAKAYKRAGLLFKEEHESLFVDCLELTDVKEAFDSVHSFVLPEVEFPSYLWTAISKVKVNNFDSAILMLNNLGTALYGIELYTVYRYEGGENPFIAVPDRSTPFRSFLSDYRIATAKNASFKITYSMLDTYESEIRTIQKRFKLIEKPSEVPPAPSWIYGLWSYLQTQKAHKVSDLIKRYSLMVIIIDAVADSTQRGEAWFK